MKRSRSLSVVIALGLLLLFAGAASAQSLLLDRGVRVEGLWCFPIAGSMDQWRYVPERARIATDERGNPSFSFIRYVENTRGASSGSGITDAAGGGVVSFDVLYETSPELRARAERALKERTGREDAVLAGPVLFESGRYVVVSSLLREEDGETETRALATGRAPVLEGNRIPLTFAVDATRATLLLESFQSATPDVSVVFQMTLSGLTDAYEATLKAHWDRIATSEELELGASALFGVFNADMANIMEALETSQAIEIETRGDSPRTQALVDRAYERLQAMLFARVEPESADPNQGGEDQSAGGNLLGFLEDIGKELSKPGAVARKMAIGASGRYQRKEIRKSGTTVIDLNHQAKVDRYMPIVANVGDLYKRFGDDESYFRTVNLDDPAFQQREIRVGVDGAILPEFEKYINSVSVTLRKRHQGGSETLQEVVLDRRSFEKTAGNLRMVYGWDQDEDRDRWRRYEHRARWSFKGGGVYETNWIETESNMIDLYAPYRRSVVEVIGDKERLAEAGVRGVSVNVEYDFFDGRRSEELDVATAKGIEGSELELTLPHDVFDYDWEVTWIRRGAPPLTQRGKDDTGILFVDELPAEAESE